MMEREKRLQEREHIFEAKMEMMTNIRAILKVLKEKGVNAYNVENIVVLGSGCDDSESISVFTDFTYDGNESVYTTDTEQEYMQWQE